MTEDNEIGGSEQSGEEGEEEVEYEVEKILDRRPSKIDKGTYEYNLKWKGYEELTWEPESSLNCPELLKAFLVDIEAKKAKSVSVPTTPTNGSGAKGGKRVSAKTPEVKSANKRNKGSVDEKLPLVGFEYGDEVDDIIGARMEDELMLFVSWKGKDEQTFVPSKIANLKIPQQVIAFYESRLRFEDFNNKNK